MPAADTQTSGNTRARTQTEEDAKQSPKPLVLALYLLHVLRTAPQRAAVLFMFVPLKCLRCNEHEPASTPHSARQLRRCTKDERSGTCKGREEWLLQSIQGQMCLPTPPVLSP
jgi:hypothetical protein